MNKLRRKRAKEVIEGFKHYQYNASRDTCVSWLFNLSSAKFSSHFLATASLIAMAISGAMTFGEVLLKKQPYALIISIS